MKKEMKERGEKVKKDERELNKKLFFKLSCLYHSKMER